MPFQTSLDIIKEIASLVKSQIDKNEKLNKDIKKETSIFNKKMQELSTEIININDKLTAYQALQPTIEEVYDLKLRVDKLLLNLKNLNTNLCDIQDTFNEFLELRENYKKSWCICKNIYTKSEFIEDIKSINEQIQTQLDIAMKDFSDLESLMSMYNEKVENLKFNFAPVRRLWIANKWDADANQESQRVTIETFSELIQSKDDGSWGLTSVHFENLKKFLTTMITADKSEDQLNSIGKGRACGTYFINSSLIANLTNIASEKLEWKDLSDLVIYFSLEALERPTDDKVTDVIIDKYNAETKLKNLRKSPEEYKAYLEALEVAEKAEKEKFEMKIQCELLSTSLAKSIQQNLDTQIQALELALGREEYAYKGKGDIDSYATFNTPDGIFRIKKGGIYTVETYLNVRNFDYWNNIYIEHYTLGGGAVGGDGGDGGCSGGDGGSVISLVARHCIIDVVQHWDYNNTSKHEITVSDNDYLRLKFSAKSSDITWKSDCYLKIY